VKDSRMPNAMIVRAFAWPACRDVLHGITSVVSPAKVDICQLLPQLPSVLQKGGRVLVDMQDADDLDPRCHRSINHQTRFNRVDADGGKNSGRPRAISGKSASKSNRVNKPPA
jgi:hypothetical protein